MYFCFSEAWSTYFFDRSISQFKVDFCEIVSKSSGTMSLKPL